MAARSSGRSRKIQIQLSETLDHQLSRTARESGVTKSAVVRVALEREFALEQDLARECARSFPTRKKELSRPRNQPLLFQV
jgi:post-segregation antitoxin (ccd killing protein)